MSAAGPVTPSSSEACRNSTRSPTPWRRAFRAAIESASGEMSVAITLAAGNSLARHTARHPLPVPTSTIKGRPSSSRPARFRHARASSTMISVSGRGASTSGPTSNSRPQNSRRRVMADIGSRRSRRDTTDSNAAGKPSGGHSVWWAMNRARSHPSTWRAISAASRAASFVSMPAAASRARAASTRSRRVTLTVGYTVVASFSFSAW